ncbi:MAG: hypothetical protein ACO1RA_12460 [Planctomycetaceae bacterium]
MQRAPEFDVAAAHRYFSAYCFNKAWELIDKKDRTAEEDQQMVSMCHASIFHWSQRSDCERIRLSVGYWQASHIQSLLNNSSEARRFGKMCLDYSLGQPPFYLGYAYEALARAEKLAGNATAAGDYLAKAKQMANQVTKTEDKELLMKDLASL